MCVGLHVTFPAKKRAENPAIVRFEIQRSVGLLFCGAELFPDA